VRVPLPRLQGVCGGRRRPKSTEPSDADFLKAVAIVARYLPGLGDPLDLDLCDLDTWMEAISEVLRLEGGSDRGDGSHRARVEAEMRRLHG